MTYRTVTVKEGEYLGPVDWNFDFQGFEARNNFTAGHIEQKRNQFEQLVNYIKEGREVQATTDGGWPRFGWGRVLKVGMYDGWPYWTPMPAAYVDGTLGGAWQFFHSITGVEIIQRREEKCS